MSESNEREGLQKRQITLADGRYLIFYTFDEPSVSTASTASTGDAHRREPDAQAEAGEERRV